MGVCAIINHSLLVSLLSFVLPCKTVLHAFFLSFILSHWLHRYLYNYFAATFSHFLFVFLLNKLNKHPILGRYCKKCYSSNMGRYCKKCYSSNMTCLNCNKKCYSSNMLQFKHNMGRYCKKCYSSNMTYFFKICNW